MAQNMTNRLILEICEKRLDIFRPRRIGKAIPQCSRQIAKFGEFFTVGRFVDAIENRDTAIGHAPRNDFICQKHKFFDEAVAIQTGAGTNVNGMTLIVEDNTRFGNLKINRTPCHAFLCQTNPQSLHMHENIGIRFGGIGRAPIAIEHALNLFIRQARAAAYNRLCNLGVYQLAIGGNMRQNTQSKAIFTGL